MSSTHRTGGLVAQLHATHMAAFAILRTPLLADVLALLARLTLAGVFWRSLLTKVQTTKLFTYTEYINDFPVERARMRIPALPLDMKPATITLFANEYDLPILPPAVAAWMATLAEFVLPLLLVVGLASRLSAMALLAMTLVIQFLVYPEAWWGTHALWIVMAGYLAVYGPGRASLDHLVGARFAR